MTTIDARDLFSPDAFENPFRVYAQMRAQSPVCPIGETGAWMVGTHAAVEEAVKRHGDFSANLRAMLVCDENDRPYVFNLDALASAGNVISTADEPDHAIHRKLMLPPLKASRIAALEQELRAFARTRVEAFVNAGGGDICAALTESLPAYVVIRLLDLGDDALDSVHRWAMMGGDFLAGRLDSAQLATVLSETRAQHEYLCAHFDALRARPREQRGDSLTATLAGGVEDGLITRDQAIGILVILFGAAGESTASLMGSAVRLLATDTDLQERLRREPELIPAFIEEAMRLEAPFKFHYRVVREDTELCGTPLAAGSLLLLCWAAANRDPAMWEEPDTLRLDRKQGDRHLGFGYGIHFCIGAPLARLEARVAIEELLAGTRQIRLDAARPCVHAPSIFVRRPLHLHLDVAS